MGSILVIPRHPDVQACVADLSKTYPTLTDAWAAISLCMASHAIPPTSICNLAPDFCFLLVTVDVPAGTPVRPSSAWQKDADAALDCVPGTPFPGDSIQLNVRISSRICYHVSI